ncbi:MAG: diguanylate cyclase [Telmatospirillum sp.]|nr:diguanylate cyclase [Telmatospirillum sp.]
MQLHIPTMFITIILFCLTQAVIMGCGAWRNDRDGLRTAAIGLCIHAAGFVLLVSRGMIPDVLSVVGGNALIAFSASVFGDAVRTFLCLAPRRQLYWGPPVLLAVAAACLMGDIQTRTILVNAIYFLQYLLIALDLLRQKWDFPRTGRNMMLSGLLIALAVMIWRAAAALFTPGDVAIYLQSTPVQVWSGLVSLVAQILVPSGFVMMAKERSDERLVLAAKKDGLTGCWTRGHIEEAARQEMERLVRYGHPVSLIMIDLDHFKDINDHHGHAAGDAILAGFADIARTSLRTPDILGRWGGEEFVVILPASGLAEAVSVAERIRTNLERHLFPGDLRATASLGVASCLSTDDWASWLARADDALYRAKAGGRNGVKVEDVEFGYAPLAGGQKNVLQLSWRADYETGQDLVDRQHQTLFGLANGLLKALADGDGTADIRALAVSLLAEAEAHFRDEERILRQGDYDLFDRHRERHTYLLGRARNIYNRFVEGRIDETDFGHYFVWELVVQHVLVEDRRAFGAAAPLRTESPARH